MITALVGYTGFVGQNLCLSHNFDALYNSKNIKEAYGTKPDLLIYAGIRAEMFTANNFPDKDFANIQEAIDNIKKISPKKLVLISTISVYPKFQGDETTDIDRDENTAYGKNRRFLEKWVEQNLGDYLIVRLPALYGKGIKKNFIFDMIQYIPALLKNQKYIELLKDSQFSRLYENRGDGFYKCIAKTKEERASLKSYFEKVGFSALNFTDSRSEYQYFNLINLWQIINNAIDNKIKLLTIATEPILSSELYEVIFNKSFVNEVAANYPIEHLKSIHAEILGGENGYLYSKKQLLDDIKDFVKNSKKW